MSLISCLGANCGAGLPLSMSAPFYEVPPEIYCNPWFFSTSGTILIEVCEKKIYFSCDIPRLSCVTVSFSNGFFSQRIEGEPDLIKSRSMHFYLPPSFEETFYKQVIPSVLWFKMAGTSAAENALNFKNVYPIFSVVFILC